VGGASVRLTNLSKRYGDVVAVEAFSLTVERGEFVTLLGPSGSGKTTVLMMLAGFVLPTAGEIALEGRPVTFDPPYRRNIGMVFQNYALFPHMTIGGNVAFPLQMRRVPKREIAERVRAALELVRLSDLGHRYPRQLSGGQQQRVALARTLVYNPHVLLMDEPLGALDRKLRQQMQLEIRRLHADLGITVIYVTHDQEEALTLSHRIVVMRAGRIEQVGPPRAVYDRPASAFVADFVGETNFLRGTVVEIAGDRHQLRTAGGMSVWVAREADLALGEAGVLVVRPERLVLVGPEPWDNKLPGRVEEVVFAGEATRYAVRVNSTETLAIKVRNGPHQRALAPGESVTLGFRAEDASMLRSGECRP
jgi:putative spermidine/putrescine transport system ATP-binding protein